MSNLFVYAPLSLNKSRELLLFFWNRKFWRGKFGGVSDSGGNNRLPPHQVVDNIPFSVIPQYKNLAFLRTKYLEEKLSIQEIATQISSSKEAVRQGLIAAGVTLREQGKPHGRPSQPKFGSRLKKGQVIPYKPEQKVIDVIKGLRSQNMSYRQIAQTLSSLGVPTKCDGKYWHPEMVRRALQ